MDAGIPWKTKPVLEQQSGRKVESKKGGQNLKKVKQVVTKGDDPNGKKKTRGKP